MLNVAMYFAQPGMIFYPQRGLAENPRQWGLGYEDVTFATADGVLLHGWYIPAPGARRVLLFFHGNAGNISHRGDSIAIFHRLGLDVFIIDYRGYGRSEGKPSEHGLYADAAAAWDFLTRTRHIPPEDIVIFGRSLGGAVAAQLAAQVQPGALILESTFSSARDVAHDLFPLLSRLVVLRYEFDTVKHLRTIRSRVLVLHSPDDDIMPFSLGEQVYRSARQPKQFVRLQGDHNTGFLLSQPDYEKALRDFLADLPKLEPESDISNR